jgi:hypothetical protein
MSRLKVLAAVLLLVAVPSFARNDAMSLIPKDAVSVGVIHLADLRTSPLSSTLFEQTDKVTADGDAEKFLSDAGLQPTKDVDLLVVATTPRAAFGTEADILIAAEGRFNVDRLTKALASRGAVKKNGYFVLPDNSSDSDHNGAVAFPNGSLALMGTEQAVATALKTLASGGTSFMTSSGLGRETARIDTKATAWAIVDVARAARLANAPKVSSHSDAGRTVAAALNKVTTVALWATDTGDSLKLGAFGLSNDTETLQLTEDAVRGALAAMRLAVQDKSPELVSVLRRFNVTRTDDSISINGTIPADTLRNFIAKQKQQASR